MWEWPPLGACVRKLPGRDAVQYHPEGCHLDERLGRLDAVLVIHWIPLAKSGQAAARAAKREVRVAARGTARNQAVRRSTLIAAAVATCWRCVLASPR